MTWAKLSAIKANLAIELTFDECLKSVKEWEASAAAPYERRGSLHRGMSRVPSFAAIKTSHSMLNVSHTGAMMAHAASGDLDGHAVNPWPAAAADGGHAAAEAQASPENGASPTAASTAERVLSSGGLRSPLPNLCSTVLHLRRKARYTSVSGLAAAGRSAGLQPWTLCTERMWSQSQSFQLCTRQSGYGMQSDT